jgi:hypothetical protein
MVTDRIGMEFVSFSDCVEALQENGLHQHGEALGARRNHLERRSFFVYIVHIK